MSHRWIEDSQPRKSELLLCRSNDTVLYCQGPPHAVVESSNSVGGPWSWRIVSMTWPSPQRRCVTHAARPRDPGMRQRAPGCLVSPWCTSVDRREPRVRRPNGVGHCEGDRGHAGLRLDGRLQALDFDSRCRSDLRARLCSGCHSAIRSLFRVATGPSCAARRSFDPNLDLVGLGCRARWAPPRGPA